MRHVYNVPTDSGRCWLRENDCGGPGADCLPDCFNLKTISDVYKISADVLLETESSGDLDAVSSKIEQLATEFVWSMANNDRYNSNLSQELGEDLWKMWKGIYFAENLADIKGILSAHVI